MSGKFVRASKYRHVFGQAAKKELCYENLKVTKNAWDSNIIQSNGQYISVNWDSSGGGAFAIIPVSEVGKAPDTVSLFRGHKGPVLDTAFNPFNKQEIASCSDDGKVLIWKIPEDYSFHHYVDENEEVVDITEPVKVLLGHTRKVGLIEYHPCAENVLASSSLDYTVKIWNTETGEDVITLQHKDLVTSFAFNYNGSLLATTSRDKKIRIWDIRTGEIVSEGSGHTGAKPSRVTWLGNTDKIVTTGFSRLSDRQVGVWDIHNIEKGPIDGFLVVDASSGVLIPYFDSETSILYIAGKGDGNIRYYEFDNDSNILYELSQYASTDPQRGFAVIPKHAVNVKDNEVVRAYKTVLDNVIEPISFIVPRRSELFQLDIFPDCPSTKPALSAKEWFDGKTVNGPILMTMEAVYEGKEPTLTESKPPGSSSSIKKETKQTEEPRKEETSKDDLESKKELTNLAVDTDVKEPQQREIGVSKPDQTLDNVLKGSKKVDGLLDKVGDQSDDEDDPSKSNDEDDESWEDVPKPEIRKSGNSLVKDTSPVSKSESVTASESKKSDSESSGDDKVISKDKVADVRDEEKEKTPEVSTKDGLNVENADIKEKSANAHTHTTTSTTPTTTNNNNNDNISSSSINSANNAKAAATTTTSTISANSSDATVHSPGSSISDSKTKETETSEQSKDQDSKKKPTLTSTVERLASLVEQLQNQISKLEEINSSKEERLQALEKKLDALNSA